ncbi:E3 ubiquitin-protein ligase TRIM45-like [Amphiura filiformis]|uniref:E3 ubiquitin-protein ligase TRIM45-like n=1 Tax=Amphiura filiformis TaxID=82378 RepID=UPI003B21DD46
MARALQVSKVDKDLRKCGICLGSLRNPRRLLCQHCFCEDCLDDWIEHQGNTGIICPYCKKPTPNPLEGVKGIPAAIGMAEAKEDYCKKLCSKCEKPDNQAIVYCKDCKHYLCQSCFDVHKAWDAMKHHRIATTEDLISGKVTLSDVNDQYCAKHEGEEKKFYCETCKKPVCRDCIVLKQCCRDHDTVPLKQAVDKHLIHVNKAMKKCSKKRQQCQKVIDKAENVQRALSSSADKAKDDLKRKETAYVKIIQNIFGNFICDIKRSEKESSEKLCKVKDSLSMDQTKIESALVQGEGISRPGSPYEVMSRCNSVLNSLKEASKVELDTVDETLANVPIPDTAWILGHNWKQKGQIKVPCMNGSGPTGIAVTSDGIVAVCVDDRVLVLSKSGDLMHTIDDGIKLGGNGDVGITSTDGFVIPKANRRCKAYDSKYKLLSKFKTYDANNKPSAARAVTVDKNGCIILGMGDKAISIHNADGSLKSSFAIPDTPSRIAVTSHEKIVVTTYNNHTLQLFNYSGECLLTFDPPPEVNTWEPVYVCCSKRDEVFVVNWGEPVAIYRYAASGAYMGCVTTDINSPTGIALSDDDHELYVAD